jgi:hypothetical protein
MISNAQNENGTFSADVKLNLHVGDQQFELGQVGPGLAILRNAQTIDATEGEIETIVDEKVNRFKVRITSPITGESKRFTFEGV